jgi:hypothetical protein
MNIYSMFMNLDRSDWPVNRPAASGAQPGDARAGNYALVRPAAESVEAR